MRSVPSQRCILLVSLLLPLALLGVAFPAFSALSWVWLAALIVFGLVDIYSAPNAFKDLRIEVEPVTRLAKDSLGKLLLHVRSDRASSLKFVLGLPLPVEFVQDEDTRLVELAGENAKYWIIEWTLTARARGIYPCPPVYVEVSSAMGLFRVRRRYPTKAEIRVYPNLRRERSQLANLFLNRGAAGVHAQRMIGQGREYEQLREYSTGDSILDIHWKASAKRGELVTKTYQVERTQEIYLVIDHSRLSGRRSTKDTGELNELFAETVLERYVTAASVLGMAAEREGDLFGLIAFGQTVSRFVRANSGRQHGQAIQDALFDLKADSGPFDLDELFTFIRTNLRRRALVIFMTDLCDAAAADEFKERVGLLASQHYVLVNSIRRMGVHPLYSGHQETSELRISDQIAGHLRWSGLQQLKVELRAAGVEFSVLDDEKLSLELVNQYLAVKQRQVL